MKKFISLLIIALFLICPVLSAEVSATTVFLTSDNVLGYDEDFKMLNEIKENIETKSNGEITVIVDSNASSPGEGTRAMTANCDYAVTIAYACAGNLLDLAEYSVNTDKTIISVNAGGLDLNNINFLRRSYDDNWSPYNFAALKKPGKFLNDSGIILIQPGQEYPDDTDDGNMDHSSSNINEYIADAVIDSIDAKSNSNRELDNDLIVTHKLNPKYLAEDSSKIVQSKGGQMEESYGSYTSPQLLYMGASYIAGYSLDVPQDYKAPENPLKYSLFTKSSYSFNDYCNIADKVVDYMNENGQAPDYIEYEGARIGYYDLIYNFALLSEDDTDASHMNFEANSDFERFYDNTLVDLLPIAIIIFMIIVIIAIFRKIIKSMRNRKNKRNKRNKKNKRTNRYKQAEYYNRKNQGYNKNGLYNQRQKPKRLNRKRRGK